MAFHPVEPNEISSQGSESANKFSYADAFSESGGRFEQPVFKSQDRTREKSSGIGLPPLSDFGDAPGTGTSNFLDAPPLALENRQGRASLKPYSMPEGHFSSFSENMDQSQSLGLAETSLKDGVAGAIERAALDSMPNLGLVDETTELTEPKSASKDIYAGASEAAPIAQLLKMRTPTESHAMPRELFETSPAHKKNQLSGGVDETARKNNIGIGNSDGLPRYRDQDLGRLPELARLEKGEAGDTGFDQLNGSPEGYLFARKLELAKTFGKPDTKYSRLVDSKGTREIQTATDFSTLETSYGDDGTCETGHYDNFRRPLLKVSEKYNNGDVEFKMVQFDYGSGDKVSPFPSQTREINYKNGQATIDTFDHSGVKVDLISSNTWS